MGVYREIADELIADMQSRPSSWTIGEFRAESDTGAEIWIANSSYGVEVSLPGGYQFGGVTFVSSLFGWWPFGWRSRLIRAVRQIALARLRFWSATRCSSKTRSPNTAQ